MMKALLGYFLIGIAICAGAQGWAQDVPQPPLTFLVAAWGDTPEAINKFSADIRTIALSGSNIRYIDGRSQWLVLFLVQPGDKILDTQSLIGKDSEVLQAIKIPVDKIIVRTFMTLNFETGVSSLNRHPIKFWIGDSAPIPLPPLSLQKTDPYDVSTFVPDFDNCKTVSPGCIRSVIAEGYLNQKTIIDGQLMNPLHYLENSFRESMERRQANIDAGSFRIRSPIASFQSVISDVVLGHQVWIYLSPTPEVVKISSFTDLSGNKILDYNTPNFPLLKTPLVVTSQHIDSKIRINPEEMKTLTGSLYDVSFKTQFILER